MNCIFANSDCNGALKHRMPLAANESSAAMCDHHWTLRQHDVRVAASTGCTCWEGYERVPGTKPCAPGSCRKKKKSSTEKDAGLGEIYDAANQWVTNNPLGWDLGLAGAAALAGGKLVDYLKKHHEKRLQELHQEHVDEHHDETAPKEAAVKDEPGFFEEEESFKGRKDDDEDIPRTIFDEVPAPVQRLEADQLDNEDDPNRKDREDMAENGRVDVPAGLPQPKAAINKCAACGDLTCLGHEENSIDYTILVAHASDDHSSCHPDGCSSFGRSFHAHLCTNCGGETPCVGTRTASVCDTFDGFCKTCFITLAGIRTALDSKELNKHMRMRNVKHQPPVTQAVVDRAMGQGHSLETAMEEVGQHRPVEKDSSKESGDSFVPPQSVANNAKRGLQLRKKYHRGGTEIGVARARDLSNRKGLSYSTVKRMKAYFDRHEVDKKGEGWGTDSAGYIAWLLWGGDAGRSWANKIVKQHEKKASVDCEMCGKPSFVCDCDKTYSETPKFASNECGTCGHNWAVHGDQSSCSCCSTFKKSSVNKLPEWLREAKLQIEADGDVIDFTRKRKERGLLTPDEVKTIFTESPDEAAERLESMRSHPSTYKSRGLGEKIIERLFEMQTVDPSESVSEKVQRFWEDYHSRNQQEIYDQNSEERPIPSAPSKPSLRDRALKVTDWLGLTDDPSAPYDQNRDWRKKSQRSPEMQAWLDDFTRRMMPSGLSNSEAIAANKCVSCGEDATEFEDDLSAKEYKISALCQKCQNETFKAPEE